MDPDPDPVLDPGFAIKLEVKILYLFFFVKFLFFHLFKGLRITYLFKATFISHIPWYYTNVSAKYIFEHIKGLESVLKGLIFAYFIASGPGSEVLSMRNPGLNPRHYLKVTRAKRNTGCGTFLLGPYFLYSLFESDN